MAQVPVINNHTGDEGTVDETWLERWPGDFTRLSDEHVPLVEQQHIAELLTAGADEASTTPNSDSTPDPEWEDKPSDGTKEKDK